MAELTAVVLAFLKAIGKYRWYAVIISWVVAIIGWAVVYKLPNDYQASARVYVDTQSILKPLLSGMTSMPNLDQQVVFMRRTLISRPNVERVMRMVDLDVKTTNAKDHEKVVDELMEKIKMGGGKAMLKTVQGEELTFMMKGKKLWVMDANGGKAQVTIKDVYQSNGVIHVIDTVLMP